MIHNLKTWTEFYQAVTRGGKTFEIRKNDRDFKVGDLLNLIEVLPEKNFKPTGNTSLFDITYILKGSEWGLDENVVVMSIRRVNNER